MYEVRKFHKWIFLPQKGRPITLAVGAGVALSVIYLLCHALFVSGAQGVYPGFITRVLSQPIVGLSLVQAVVIAAGIAFSRPIFDRGGKDFRNSGSTLATSVMRACGYDDPEEWEAAKGSAKASLKQYVQFWKFLLGI